MKTTKKIYDAPQVEIVEVQTDGIVCTSALVPGGKRTDYPSEDWTEGPSFEWFI